MDKLVTVQEVQALVGLLNKCTMSVAEQLWVQMFTNRLFTYASTPPPKKDASLSESETVDLDLKQPGPSSTGGGRRRSLSA